MKLGDKRLNVSTNANLQVVAILVIVHWTKSIFEHGREFDESNPYMNFGRNWVINDLV